MKDNLRGSVEEVDDLAGEVDVVRQLDRLRVEIEELRASRKQLVLAADADRRGIERDLHDGIHQHLVALAVNLQLLGVALDSDPAAARNLVEELGRDVQRGLEETVLLGQRIHPATFETAGLGALLRSAAVDAGVPASVDVTAGRDCPPEVEMTVYLCWLAALAHATCSTRPTLSVREDGDALEFDIVGAAAGSDTDIERLRGRVEALGGRLTLSSGRDGRITASCSVPLS